MDYASDIDMYGTPVRQKRHGGFSFLVIAIGTVCLAAAWILTTSDPYSELANRVVEIRSAPDTADLDGEPLNLMPEPVATADGPIGLLPDRLDSEQAEGPIGLLPDGPAAGEGEAFREMMASLPAADSDGTHPSERERRAAAQAAPVRGPHPRADDARMTVPVAEFAGPPEPGQGSVESELTKPERRAIQRRLRMAGHSAGAPDGVFGPNTRAAITSFQEAEGLPATGQLDGTTLTLLNEMTDAEYAAWAESVRTSSAARRAKADAGEQRADIVLDEAYVPTAPGSQGWRSDSSAVRDFSANSGASR